MKINKKFSWFFLTGFLLIFLLILIFLPKELKDDKGSQNIFQIEIEGFGDFLSSINKFDLKGIKTDNYYLGISPHHLVASDMIAEVISHLLNKKIKTIFLIGPNHDELGNFRALSSEYIWETEGGVLYPDLKKIDELTKKDLVMVDDTVVSHDHSITSLIPYLKNYAPKAKIVPIVLSRNYSLDDLDKLAEELNVYLKDDENALLFSIDFSHYLDSKLASEKDKETLAFIKNYDYENIMKLTNDNVDCPSCLSLLLMIDNENGKNKMEVLQNTNSGEMFGEKNNETTSYFTMLFKSPKEKIKEPIRMLFFGDLMLDRYVGSKINAKGFDFLFEKVDKEFFSEYNLVSANLEGAVTYLGNHYPPQKDYDFAFDPETVKKLKDYNFNFFAIANNHLTDQGEQGVEETQKNLDKLGFNYSGCRDGEVGDCSSKIIEINGKKIGMVSLSIVGRMVDSTKTEELLQGLKKKTDFIVVNIHWGEEYKGVNITQKNFAHKVVDLGADVIIGHHPHVVQEIETYKGKKIYYSLGNFIFDQYFSKETQEGLAVGLEINKKKIEYSLYPFKSQQSQVELLEGSEKDEFIKRLIN